MPVQKQRHNRSVPKWNPKMEQQHVEATWAQQRRIVRWTTYPTIFCIALVFAWSILHAKGNPPAYAWVVLLGSFALSLVAALVFWRCPDCSEILYRTSKSGAGFLFWLSDPPDCPYCGVKLRNPEDLD